MLQEEEHIKQKRAAMRRKVKASGEAYHGGITPGARGGADSERTDALTQKPINFHTEEKTRRKETDSWLERHFGGSEWSLSQGSSGQSNPIRQAHTRSRFYKHHRDNEENTFESSAVGEDFNTKVRRAQSFNCIPINYNNPASRVIKHTTTTYRPGMEGKVVYSSITKNVAPFGSDNPKIKAYHSASNLNSTVARNTNKFNHSTTSLLNGIVKEHTPPMRKKDTSIVREIPINTINGVRRYHHSQDPADQNLNQPHRPPRRNKSVNAGTSRNTLLKSTGDLQDSAYKTETDQNYYENRRSYYFGTSADNLATENACFSTRHPPTNESRVKEHYYPGGDRRKSRKDQLIMDSSALKTYDRVQSAPDSARQYHHATNIYDRTHRGESTTTGDFQSTAGLLGGRQEEVIVERQVPIQEEVYHDSPRPDRKPKRLVPTVEGKKVSKKEHDRVVYRSESTRRPIRQVFIINVYAEVFRECDKPN